MFTLANTHTFWLHGWFFVHFNFWGWLLVHSVHYYLHSESTVSLTRYDTNHHFRLPSPFHHDSDSINQIVETPSDPPINKVHIRTVVVRLPIKGWSACSFNSNNMVYNSSLLTNVIVAVFVSRAASQRVIATREQGGILEVISEPLHNQQIACIFYANRYSVHHVS